MLSINPAANITFKGRAMQLVGRPLQLNRLAPDFMVVNSEMEEVKLGHFKGKMKVITSLVSLDTPVCEIQANEVNKKMAMLGPNIIVIMVSKDLPFAQKRFCAAYDMSNLLVMSDYKYSSFGINYGLLVKELNLLARSILILDSDDVVRYIQVGKELTHQLDYDDALRNLEMIVQAGSLSECIKLSQKYSNCEVDALPLPINIIEHFLLSLADWQLVDNKKLVKEIEFGNFSDARYFLDMLAIISEEQGHYPIFTLIYNKLKITLYTYKYSVLTVNDFIMAKIIDELRERV